MPNLTSAERPIRVFMVAGETSGDILGAGLMAELSAHLPDGTMFRGVGGDLMVAGGLDSLFPMTDIAVMGIGPVLARLPSILRRIDMTARAAIAWRPDVVVLIDSPDFTHRVARKIRRQLPDTPIVVYVSPTVWFWRPGRAAKLARFCTRLLALLPFEPAVHQLLGGPPTTYVGHPFVEKIDTVRAMATPAQAGAPKRIVVLPGSRRSEVTRLTRTFGEAIGIVRAQIGPVDVVIPVVEHVRTEVEAGLLTWPFQPKLVSGEAAKLRAFAEAELALAASGTVTLELALSRVPTVAAYRLDWIGRRLKYFIKAPKALTSLLTVRTAQLANVILNDKVIPEFIDEDCTPDALAAALIHLATNPEALRRQTDAFERLERIMRPSTTFHPAQVAAMAVIDTIGITLPTNRG